MLRDKELMKKAPGQIVSENESKTIPCLPGSRPVNEGDEVRSRSDGIIAHTFYLIKLWAWVLARGMRIAGIGKG
jgi:hypothetical protein